MRRAISANRFEDVYKPLPPPGDPSQNTWFGNQVQNAINFGFITERQVWGLNDSDTNSKRIYACAGFHSNFIISSFVVTERPWASEDDFAVWV